MKNIPKRYSLDAALEAACFENRIMWVMRNDCQGIFHYEVYWTREDCEAAWDRDAPEWREWTNARGETDGRAVPVAIIEIPRGSIAHWDAERLNRERKESSARYAACERDARARLLSIIKGRSS